MVARFAILFACVVGTPVSSQVLTEIPQLEIGCGSSSDTTLNGNLPGGIGWPAAAAPNQPVQRQEFLRANGSGLPLPPVAMREAMRQRLPAALRADQAWPPEAPVDNDAAPQDERRPPGYGWAPPEVPGEATPAAPLTTALPAWYVEQRATRVTTGHASASPAVRVGSPPQPPVNFSVPSARFRGGVRSGALRYLRRGCGG